MTQIKSQLRALQSESRQQQQAVGVGVGVGVGVPQQHVPQQQPRAA